MSELAYTRKVKIIILLTVLLFLGGLVSAQDKLEKEKPREEPIKGISITLPVYSGMPNPQWWYTEGPAFDTLVMMLKSMKAVPESLFNYDEWNRPGYAIFRIAVREIEGLPKHVNVWRDKVYVPQDGKKQALYSREGAKIYDFLVRQAEERGHKEFFVNYHKSKK